MLNYDCVAQFDVDSFKPGIFLRIEYMGLVARKPVIGGLRTTQVQTSLRICAV